MAEHEIMTVEEVAGWLRVSERTVYDWAQRGEIPCGKLGNTWRFKRGEIQRWIDARLAGHKGDPSAHGVRGQGGVLAPERVLLLEQTNKHDALTTLVDCLSRTPEVRDAEELTEAIFRREKLMSTGIGLGVGVPHVRLGSVSDLVMALGISHDGIPDYESIDDQPVKIICMVAASMEQHEQYLSLLSMISGKLKHGGFRESLLSAPDAGTVFKVFTG